ncbi:MAG: hypothetical protein ACO3ZW_01260 [Opitutales bacterium]|jgi:cytochrome c-type biogenesis protein CcmH/NrfG
MPGPRHKNILYRLVWSISHTPLRALESVQFALLAWVVISALMGFGGFLGYGEPMAGVSKLVILLSLLHAVMLVFRINRPGIDPVLLLPVPFLIYAWLHFRFISPAGWEAGALWAAYLQAYVLFFVVYNSIHSIRSARWALALIQMPIIFGLGGAFLRFYLFPEWIQEPSRMSDPAFAEGAGGFLQDPANMGALIILLVPMCVILAVKHIRTSPAWVYYCALGATLLVGFLLTSHLQGLVILGLVVLATPLVTCERWPERVRMGTYLLLAGLIGSVLLWFGTQALRDRLGYYFSGATDPAGETSREMAWDIFLENPLLGQGLGSFSAGWEARAPAAAAMEVLYPVGGYVDILAETGLTGFLLLAVVVAALGLMAFRAWAEIPYLRLNKEVAHRLMNFPKGDPIHRRLLKEKGRMSTRKAALGSLSLGLLGLMGYLGWDYSLKLPVLMFMLSMGAGALAAFSRGYQPVPAKGRIWIVAAALPVVLSVVGASVGLPRYYANHLTYTVSESLDALLADPEEIFAHPEKLGYIETAVGSAVNLLPDHGGAWVLLGNAGMAHLETQLESPEAVAERALPVLERAQELAPFSWKATFNLARARALTGAPTGEVEQLLRQAHKQAPGRVEPVAFLGAILTIGGSDPTEGGRLLEIAKTINPRYEGLQTVQLEIQTGASISREGAAARLAGQFPLLPSRPARIKPAGLPVSD